MNTLKKHKNAGEKELSTLLKTMQPTLHEGEFVFVTVDDIATIDIKDAVMIFREQEAFTLIVNKERADKLNYGYSLVCSWITLTVHSSLEAVGLTAAFSKALSDNGISCNVVAAFYHDHIFVAQKDADKAMKVLKELSEGRL